jgi:uncharacterized membrane protein YidH (DUF202 family)
VTLLYWIRRLVSLRDFCVPLSQVKQQIEEIDRLTHIVSAIERDMVSIKRQYEVRIVACLAWQVVERLYKPHLPLPCTRLMSALRRRWRSATTPASS